MVLGGGTFGRWLGHVGRALMSEISAFIKVVPESSHAPSTTWGEQREKTDVYWSESKSLLETKSAGIGLEFPGLQNRKK